AQVLVQAGALGHVGEGPVAVVVVEGAVVGRRVFARRSRYLAGLHENDVEEAVVIVVYERAPGPSLFHIVEFAGRAVVVREAEARRGGDIPKQGGFGGLHRRGALLRPLAGYHGKKEERKKAAERQPPSARPLVELERKHTRDCTAKDGGRRT